MSNISEKTAYLGYLLYSGDAFREGLVEQGIRKEELAFWAATFALKSQHESGEIDNFGTNPTIKEVESIIVKLSQIEGEQ